MEWSNYTYKGVSVGVWTETGDEIRILKAVASSAVFSRLLGNSNADFIVCDNKTCRQFEGFWGESKTWFKFQERFTPVTLYCEPDYTFVLTEDGDVFSIAPDSLKAVITRDEFLSAIYDTSFGSKELIDSRPQTCGCFSCGYIFPSSELTDSDYAREPYGYHTPRCPKCGMDTVICEASGAPIEDWFLSKLSKRYCGGMVAY